MSFSIADGKSAYIKYAKDIASIDSTVFSDDMCATPLNELSRYLHYPEEFVILLDDGVPAGYIQYFPIKSSYTKVILADDKIHDDDITFKDLAALKIGEKRDIYILSIALLPAYQGTGAMKVLGSAFSEILTGLNKSGRFIGNILSTAISDGGRRALSRFGLKDIKTLEGGYSLYWCTFDEFARAYEGDRK